jgi:hypothetical protein
MGLTAQEQVAQAMNEEDAFSALVKLLNKLDPELKNEAAIGLKSFGDARAVKYLIPECMKAKKNSNTVLVEALTYFDCSGYELDLLKIGMQSNFESQNYIVEALQNISYISDKSNRVITSSVNLQRELILNNKVIDISNLEFLNSALEIIGDIPLKATAQIINFPVAKRKKPEIDV